MKMNKWRKIHDFKNVVNDLYEVSYDGDVRDARTKSLLHKKIATKKRHPYYAVYLKRTDGRSEWILIHQLVATFFVAKPKNAIENELVPDHLDNNGLNNFYRNLDWKTRSENIKYAHIRGEINNAADSHPGGTLVTNDEVRKVCSYLEQRKTYNEIIELMNFPNTPRYRKLLVRIKNRIAWKSISKDYFFDQNTPYLMSEGKFTLDHLDEIRDLIDQGFSDTEIVYRLWGSDCEKIKSKQGRISNIRHGKTFKNVPRSSSIRES